MVWGNVCLRMCVSVWNRLSTYEYIVRQRHRVDNRDLRKPGSVKETAAPSVLKVTDWQANKLC